MTDEADKHDIQVTVSGPPIPRFVFELFPGVVGVVLRDDMIEVQRLVDGVTVDELWRIESLAITDDNDQVHLSLVKRTERR